MDLKEANAVLPDSKYSQESLIEEAARIYRDALSQTERMYEQRRSASQAGVAGKQLAAAYRKQKIYEVYGTLSDSIKKQSTQAIASAIIKKAEILERDKNWWDLDSSQSTLSEMNAHYVAQILRRGK